MILKILLNFQQHFYQEINNFQSYDAKNLHTRCECMLFKKIIALRWKLKFKSRSKTLYNFHKNKFQNIFKNFFKCKLKNIFYHVFVMILILKLKHHNKNEIFNYQKYAKNSLLSMNFIYAKQSHVIWYNIYKKSINIFSIIFISMNHNDFRSIRRFHFLNDLWTKRLEKKFQMIFWSQSKFYTIFRETILKILIIHSNQMSFQI